MAQQCSPSQRNVLVIRRALTVSEHYRNHYNVVTSISLLEDHLRIMPFSINKRSNLDPLELRLVQGMSIPLTPQEYLNLTTCNLLMIRVIRSVHLKSSNKNDLIIIFYKVCAYLYCTTYNTQNHIQEPFNMITVIHIVFMSFFKKHWAIPIQIQFSHPYCFCLKVG